MFSNDNNVETIAQLLEVFKHYIGLQQEYVKLDVIEKVVRLVTAITVACLSLLLIVICFVFLSFALAAFLKPMMGETGAYCTVAGIYILLLIVFFLCRHRLIERPLVHLLTGILLSK